MECIYILFIEQMHDIQTSNLYFMFYIPDRELIYESVDSF